ncbi:MAG: sugar ABC transporter substrate-binding protein [Anaerolineae bacterium]|nr:sugar ABC transporter substrate-binding protein [Anaerolineae bacterium]
MRHAKRCSWLLVVLLFALVVSVAYAQDVPVIGAQNCAEPGNLTMWVWDENWARVIGSAIDVWSEKYCPGATVDLQVQPWQQYWDLLKTNVAGGNMPDVFNVSQDRFFFYASNDALLDLQTYFDEAGVDTSVWGSGMIDPYRWGDNGDLYAAPVNWDTIVIFYNKDIFDAAGISYPSEKWDWYGFAAAAAALTNAEQDIYGAAVYSEYQSGYPNWIASTGIPPIVGPGRTQCTLTETSSLDALNFLKDLYDNGYMPSVSIMGGASADDAFNFWLAGKLAMVSAGSWKLPTALEEATFNWDVVRLPRNPETGRTRSIVHSVGYVASANTPNPDLAANLIVYLSSDEGQRFFAEAGGVAPANPAVQQIWVDSFGDTEVNIQAFIDATEDSQGVTVFDEIWDKINTELVVNVFDLGVSVEQAAQDACDFINTQLSAVR